MKTNILQTSLRWAVCSALLLSMALSVQAQETTIYSNNFDQFTSPRVYTDDDLDNDWDRPTFNNGVTEGRVTIVTGEDAFGGSGSSLCVEYPEGIAGPGDGGAQWKYDFEQPYEECFLRYKVKFDNGFDFVRGGKLPGLAGGTAPTGSTQANGVNGWTGRLMWRTLFTGVSGSPEQLVSNAISYGKYTDSGFDQDGRQEDRIFFLDENDEFIRIDSGRWYEFEQRVVMNNPGVSDGIIQIWLDGQLVHNQQDVLLRTTPDLQIDVMYFSTFFGGGSSWAASKDEKIYFDDFEIFVPSEGGEETGGEETGGEETGGEETGGEETGGEETGGEETGGEETGGEETGGEETGGEETGGEETGGEEEEEAPEPRFLRVPGTFDTIQEALDDANDGDTIAIRGAHRGNFVVNKSVFFRGYTGTTVNTNSRDLPVIRVAANDVRIFRLDVRGGTHGVCVDPNSQNVTVESMIVRGTTEASIHAGANCSNLLIFRNFGFHNDGDDYVIENSNGVTVKDNKSNFCAGNSYTIVGGNDCHIEGNVSFTSGSGFTVYGNRSNIVDNNCFSAQGKGFMVVGNDVMFTENLALRSGSTGFAVYESEGGHFYDNVSRDNGGSGMELAGCVGVTVTDILSRGNAVYGFGVFYSDDNNFTENFADNNYIGFFLDDTSVGNLVTDNKSDDHSSFGLLDNGTDNVLENNTERRNAR